MCGSVRAMRLVSQYTRQVKSCRIYNHCIVVFALDESPQRQGNADRGSGAPWDAWRVHLPCRQLWGRDLHQGHAGGDRWDPQPVLYPDNIVLSTHVDVAYMHQNKFTCMSHTTWVLRTAIILLFEQQIKNHYWTMICIIANERRFMLRGSHAFA